MKRRLNILLAVVCAGAALGLTACGNNEGSQSSPTVTRVAVSDTSENTSAVSVPVSGETTDLSAELVGTWKMNLDLSTIPEESHDMYRQMFDTSAASLTLKADGTFEWKVHETATGTWSMIGQTVYLTTSDGLTESYNYTDGKLVGIESYVLYFTR